LCLRVRRAHYEHARPHTRVSPRARLSSHPAVSSCVFVHGTRARTPGRTPRARPFPRRFATPPSHSSAIATRVISHMARVIDAGVSRPVFTPSRANTDAIDTLLNQKMEVRASGNGDSRRGNRTRTPDARTSNLNACSSKRPADSPAPLTSSPLPPSQAALEHPEFSLDDIHIACLDDMVAQDDGGLSWCVVGGNTRAESAALSRHVPTVVSFSSPGGGKNSFRPRTQTLPKFPQITRELTHQNPLSFLSIPFKPETNRHPTLTFASLLEDANETDLTGELKHSGFVSGLCGARQGQGQYTQHNQHTGGNLGPDYGSNFPTNYSHDRRSGGAKPPGRHGWRRDEDATLTSLVREVRGFPNHHVPPS